MKAFIFLSLILIPILSQGQKKQKIPTKAEIDKQIKAMESDPNVNAAMKQAGIKSLTEDDVSGNLYKISPKKTAILIEVEKVSLTESTFLAYIKNLQLQAWAALTVKMKAETELIWNTIQKDSFSSQACVAIYYQGKPKTALALALKAAANGETHPLSLSNLAALLNLNGLPQKSIPILKFLQSKFPGNTTVLNNLGQAYLALGEVAKAETLLIKATSISPNHVESNKSLALIYRSRSQIPKAKACIQKSLKGGYSEGAKEIAEALGLEDETIDESIIEIYKDYHSNFFFNYFKYELPPFSESVADGPKTAALHKSFQAQLEVEIEKYSKLVEEESAKMQKSISNLIADYKNNGPKSYAYSPMFEKAKRMLWYYANEFSTWGATDGAKFFMDHANREAEIKKAEDEEEARIFAMNLADNCGPLERVQDKFLPLYADNDRAYLEKWEPVVRQYLTDVSYWFQFTNVVDNAGVTIYGMITSYLKGLHNISKSVRIGTPICNPVVIEPVTSNAIVKEKPDCPFSIEINLLVAKMTADCSKFGLEVNAGISLSYEKDFDKNETTLAIGIGLGFQIPENLPILDLSGSIKASEQLYIVFNGDNQPTDLGFKFKAGVSTGLGVSGPPGAVNFENSNSGIEAGYKLSFVNSTINFSGEAKGSFKSVFN